MIDLSRLRRLASLTVLAAAAATVMGFVEQRPAPRAPGDRFDVLERSIPDLQDAMRSGEITARGLVEIYLARIDAYDRRGPRLNAIVSLNPRALDEAAALDRERAAGRVRGPLHGIPLVIKDNFDFAGLPTTAGTLAFAALFPTEDAFQVKRLREQGAVIVGKTNLHELASGITTIGSLAGQTRNPYDLARTPGGSSGGTGAAVAANFAAAGLGTDTCGSVRIPASHNSLVGLRVSAGLSSRSGIVPLSHTQDVAGPIARSVGDAAILLDATVGVDPRDESTRSGEGHVPPSYRDALKPGTLKGARIGILTSMFGDQPEDSEAGAIVRRALDEMKKQGAETIEASVPGLDDLLRGSSVIDAEFKFDLADYLARVPNAPVHSLGDILDRGLYHAALETALKRRNAVQDRDGDAYRRARIKRDAIRQAVTSALEENRLDALAYPTMRRKPVAIGESQPGTTCQLSASSGLPALSVPAGFTPDGLPIGLELLGRQFDESRLLALGYGLEESAHIRRPPWSTPALVNGKPPAPLEFGVTFGKTAGALVTVGFTFDPLTNELRYQASAAGIAPADLIAAWMHRGGAGESGPAIVQLLGLTETKRADAVTLSSADRERLFAGRLYLALYTRSHPQGERVQLAAIADGTKRRAGLQFSVPW
jgi:amidase